MPRGPNPFTFDVRSYPGTTLLFFGGVFLTFAPAMLLTLKMSEPPSATAMLLWSVMSGICGCLWALTGMWTARLLPVAVLVQATLGFLVGQRWTGPLALPVSGFNLQGLIALLCVAGGYACFVSFILRQGSQAMRLWTEMDLAARIHHHLVPPLRAREGDLDIEGLSVASGTMGGDLAECVKLPDGAMEIVIADVSGHGVRAGVVMAMLKSLLHARRIGNALMPLPQALAELNRVLCDLGEPGMFATMAIARISRDGAVRYASAGHPPILLRRGREVGRLAEGSLPLGVALDVEFTEHVAMLDHGASLVLYSDGLVEVHVSKNRLLGLDGLVEIVRSTSGADAGALLRACFDGVRARSVDAEQLDDQTAVVALRH